MNLKICVLLSLAAIFSAPVFAVDTTEIEKAAKKSVLDQADMTIIDNFVAATVEEVLAAEDFSRMGELRAAFLAYSKSSQPSAEVQYKPTFSASAVKHLGEGLKKAKNIADEEFRNNATLNLMIMLESLRDPKLASAALQMLDSDNTAVRYWAVKALASMAMEKSGQDLAPQIVGKFNAILAKESSPEVLEVMARFGSMNSAAGAKKLLLAIADIRISGYENWTVSSFSIDGPIMKMLAENVTTGSENDPAAVKFAQLYSFVIQRYCNDANLKGSRKQELANVIISTEAAGLSKLGLPQTTLSRAIREKGGTAAVVLAEYKTLYGENGTPGKLLPLINVKTPVKELPARPVTQKKLTGSGSFRF